MFRIISYTVLVLSLLFGSNNSIEAQEVLPVAIIGSGCAGLSAAHTISEYGFRTVIFAGPIKGGDLNTKTVVGNWLGLKTSMGDEIMPKLIDQALSYGAEIIPSTIESVDFSVLPFKLTDSNGHTYLAHKVVIATGTTERLLSIPGAKENRNRIFYSWDIQKNLDAYQSKTKGGKAAVIGGGVDAMKKAIYAYQGGAKEIRLFVRSETLKMPGWRKSFLEKKGIKVSYAQTIRKIESLDNDQLRLIFQNNDNYDVDLVVVSIGRVPRSTIFKNELKTNETGFIMVDAKSLATSVPGVYACGDVTDASGLQPQALIAVGNGMVAGYSVVEELMQLGTPQSDVFFKKFRSEISSRFKDKFNGFFKK